MLEKNTIAATLAARLVISVAKTADADKLDDIIAAGELRCSSSLDFSPTGFCYKKEPAEINGGDPHLSLNVERASSLSSLAIRGHPKSRDRRHSPRHPGIDCR